MPNIHTIGYLYHSNRGVKSRHQQDQVLTTDGLMKALTAGSHNNAEWMQFILEVFALPSSIHSKEERHTAGTSSKMSMTHTDLSVP